LANPTKGRVEGRQALKNPRAVALGKSPLGDEGQESSALRSELLFPRGKSNQKHAKGVKQLGSGQSPPLAIVSPPWTPQAASVSAETLKPGKARRGFKGGPVPL
jgi:hypothetical protein